ncbi:MAG: RICIN domain-containing protein [Reinekea sp.]|jgi:hypothetical protein
MKFKKTLLKSVILSSLFSIMLPVNAADKQLVVDLGTDTGAVKHGAAGFLYGLGSHGVPTANVLIPLSPQAAAQKAPDGAQHPNGDALKVAPVFVAAGGKRIEIYMQDIYQKWPYENLGIQDYLDKTTTIATKVVNDPYRSTYNYVPFNEPNGNWYPNILNYSSSAGEQDRQRFFSDWKAVYQRIRSIDTQAKIVGPNLTHYHSRFHEDFMAYCVANSVVPDYFSWHELGSNFFTQWYSNVNHYRSIETDLGISPRPISINEYARISGDLGVPGNLVQFIARFENSKVDAMLAYWTAAGTLNDLITENNKATGGWWLYKWYGELTGHTVQVSPPSQNDSLQGVAALDVGKKQARIIFGGSPDANDVFSTDVVVKGFGSASYFGDSVHVSVWEVNNTGTNASPSPRLVQEDDYYNASNNEVVVTVENMKALSAYYMIVTPDSDLSSASNSNRYEAEYAKLKGTAAVTYGSNSGYSGTYFVEGYGATSNASTNFVVNVTDDGYYDLDIRYSAGPIKNAPATRTLRMTLNGSDLTDLSLPATEDWNSWKTETIRAFLRAGINLVDLKAFTTDESDAVNLDYLEVKPTSEKATLYEAESSVNTLGGAAVVTNDSDASGGQYVGYIGNGSNNTLRFNQVNVAEDGLYRMVVRFANAEVVGEHSYNNNVVDRIASVSVNGQAATDYYFSNTRKWNAYHTMVFDVNLNAGNNTITFSNADAYAPNIDSIQIAAAISSNSGIDPNANYKLVNRFSGKLLEVESSSTADGANVVQWVDQQTTNQHWQFSLTTDGYYKILNRNSGKLLDVSGASNDDGADVIQWRDNGDYNQQWSLQDAGDGYYLIVNRNSGKALDVYNASTADGADVVQWRDNGGYNQQWSIAIIQ